MTRRLISLARLLAATASLALGAPAWAGGGACDPAIPDPGPDQVFTNLQAFEVAGLYATLWSFRAHQLNGNDPIEELVAINGHTLRVRARSWSCTNLHTADPWLNDWACTLEVTGGFALKNLTYGDIPVGSQGVSTWPVLSFDDYSLTATMFLQETVDFYWDAVARRLTVSLAYPGDATARNHQRTWGRYVLDAATFAPIATSSGDATVGASFTTPAPLSVSTTKTGSGTVAYVRARIDGSPFWADRYPVAFMKLPEGVSCFAMRIDWETEAMADLAVVVTPHTLACPSGYEHRGTLAGAALNDAIGLFDAGGEAFSQAFQYGSVGTASCKTWSEPLVSTLSFRARDAFAPDCGATFCGGETVGLRSLSRFKMVDQRDGTCRRWFEVASTIQVDWALHLLTGSGESGGGFDIGPGTTLPAWLSPQVFPATYACP